MPTSDFTSESAKKFLIVEGLLFFMTLVLLLLQGRFAQRIKSVRSALRNFDAYARQYESEWGSPTR